MATRVVFAVENLLGHRTVMANLKRSLRDCAELDSLWIPIDPSGNGVIDHIPHLRDKHALVLALSARRRLRAAQVLGKVDVTFLHTQRVAHLLVDWMRKNPTFLSIDGTPSSLEQYREVYGLSPQKGTAYASVRDLVHRRTYHAAQGIICMSSLVRDAIVQTYGVEVARTLVLLPGVDIARWSPGQVRKSRGEVRLLFVGGDFARKGGAELLRWARTTKAVGWSLDVVTEERVESSARVRVHAPFKASDPGLIDLMRRAHLLVLPTKADLSPWVVAEAKATGTPVLTTRVGALPEMVRDGVDGWLIDRDDPEALSLRLDAAIQQPARLSEFGIRGREDAELRFNSSRNAELLLDFMGVTQERERALLGH